MVFLGVSLYIKGTGYVVKEVWEMQDKLKEHSQFHSYVNVHDKSPIAALQLS